MQSILSRINLESLTDRFLAILPSLVAAFLVLLAFWFVYRITSVGLRAALTRAGLQPTLINMLVGSVYRVTLMLVGFIMAADQMGINVAAALAGLGVAGIAIGFAAQDSLSNIIAGFIVFWDKPFLVGEWVTVAGEYGQVSDITMRSTRIRTNSNTYVVIPNKRIIDEVLVNHSKHGETRLEIPVGIAYKEDVTEARRVMLDAVAPVDGVALSPEPDVVMVELGDSSVNLMLRVWIDNAADEKPVFSRALEAAKVALDAADIQIPFPHLQLFVDDVEDRVVDKVGRLPGLGRSA